jgi:two-component system, cell cycle sensor histidine kinase and response regulator CckA
VIVVDLSAVGGTRTVLVVESNPIVRKFLQVSLERGGLAVIVATSGTEAMLAEVGFPGPIDLLVFDVMMPDIMGPELAMSMKKRRPDMRVMFMSHYPDGGMLLLNYGWYFTKKLFLPVVLLAKVNEVLSSAEPEQGIEHFDTRR